MFDDVPAVFELNEAGIPILLMTEEDLCDLVAVADATLCWTLIPAQANAKVAAIQHLVAGFGARGAIARLVAKLAAALVAALPGTRLAARDAGLAALLHALAVDTTVLAGLATRRTLAAARLRAHVRANQEALTVVTARQVKASLETPVAVARTGVAALQHVLTGGPTGRPLCLRFVEASVLLGVATAQS